MPSHRLHHQLHQAAATWFESTRVSIARQSTSDLAGRMGNITPGDLWQWSDVIEARPSFCLTSC